MDGRQTGSVGKISQFFERVLKYLSHKIDKKQLLKLLEEENPEEFTDYGEISIQQFSKQRREMEKLDGYQAVAMFHHHFFFFQITPNSWAIRM